MNYAQWLLALIAIQVAIPIVPGNETKLARPRIIDGYDARISDVPFLLSLHVKQKGHLCGATILSAWWGMTAHHCIDLGIPAAKNYFVRSGSTSKERGGIVHQVRKFYPYDPDFIYSDNDPPPHDIALFRVRNRFRFSDNVRPAKLPREGTVPPKLLRVSGWGLMDVNIYSSSIFIKAVEVMRVEWEDCVREASFYESRVSEKRHLCYGGNGPDSCSGDSGGPLDDSKTVYGVVSFGMECGGAPGIYMKVSFYRQWIKRIANI